MIPSMISTLLPSGHSISSQYRTRSSQFWSGSWLTVSALSRVAGGRCRPPAPSEPDVRLFTASGSSGPLESRGSVILLGPSLVAGVVLAMAVSVYEAKIRPLVRTSVAPVDEVVLV